MKLDLQHLNSLLQQCLVHLSIDQDHSNQVNQADSELKATLPAFHIHCFNTISSTNQVLWELIEQGAGEGTVAIALQQQAGRGQWGRQWQSPLGGLYLSLALTPNIPIEQSGQLTLCSAWGIAAALQEYSIPVRLKWPNDLVVDRLKLGGILTETRLQQKQIHRAVVGAGINWINPVPETGINLQTILTQQPQPTITSLEMLAAIALQGIMTAYQIWQQHGIETLLPHYEALLTSLGHPVRVDGDLGIITGVSTAGDLRVRLQEADSSRTTDLCLKPGTVSLGYGKAGTE